MVLIDDHGMTVELRCAKGIAEVMLRPNGFEDPPVSLYYANTQKDKRKYVKAETILSSEDETVELTIAELKPPR